MVFFTTNLPGNNRIFSKIIPIISNVKDNKKRHTFFSLKRIKCTIVKNIECYNKNMIGI